MGLQILRSPVRLRSYPFLVGVVGNISACHAEARGSIPRLGIFFLKKKLFQKKKYAATNEIRTRDLSLTKRVLYQLSYSGEVISSFLQSGKTKFFFAKATPNFKTNELSSRDHLSKASWPSG